MAASKHIAITSVARSVPYDDQVIPTNLGDDVQTAIDNLYFSGGVSASPGFSWGRSGSINSGTWLQNETVPSNLAGRAFPLYNGELVQMTVANDGINTFNASLYEHDGTTYTLLATVSLTAQRSKTDSFTGVIITQGKELAVQITSGSCKNCIVTAIFKGTIV